jgi:hypothetical protein
MIWMGLPVPLHDVCTIVMLSSCQMFTSVGL